MKNPTLKTMYVLETHNPLKKDLIFAKGWQGLEQALFKSGPLYKDQSNLFASICMSSEKVSFFCG